jgi:hypothetical protein
MTARIPGRALGIHYRSTPASSHTGCRMEVFVDFNCPFSKRLSERLMDEVKPAYGDGLELIFQPVPQTWHPSSCISHECFHSATLVNPSTEMEQAAFKIAMKHAYEKFSDEMTYDKSRRQINEEWANLYREGGFDKDAFLGNLALQGTGNAGTECTRLMKLYTKQHRQLAIHVTPTTRINGHIVDTSSGWSLDEWKEFLDPLVTSATK